MLLLLISVILAGGVTVLAASAFAGADVAGSALIPVAVIGLVLLRLLTMRRDG